ncbi:hypothetical protein GGF32_009122 [Allomyces javanicus]|nr:hypothetical protein GGF32_009122 [Allomyces javanicus]
MDMALYMEDDWDCTRRPSCPEVHKMEKVECFKSVVTEPEIGSLAPPVDAHEVEKVECVELLATGPEITSLAPPVNARAMEEVEAIKLIKSEHGIAPQLSAFKLIVLEPEFASPMLPDKALEVEKAECVELVVTEPKNALLAPPFNVRAEEEITAIGPLLTAGTRRLRCNEVKGADSPLTGPKDT